MKLIYADVIKRLVKVNIKINKYYYLINYVITKFYLRISPSKIIIFRQGINNIELTLALRIFL